MTNLDRLLLLAPKTLITATAIYSSLWGGASVRAQMLTVDAAYAGYVNVPIQPKTPQTVAQTRVESGKAESEIVFQTDVSIQAADLLTWQPLLVQIWQ